MNTKPEITAEELLQEALSYKNCEGLIEEGSRLEDVVLYAIKISRSQLIEQIKGRFRAMGIKGKETFTYSDVIEILTKLKDS